MRVKRKNMTNTADLNNTKCPSGRQAGALALGLMAWFLSANLWAQNNTASRIQPFGQAFVQPERVVDQQTRMIFYRTQQSSAVYGAASVYVNGAYHASLVPGGYSILCMPIGNIELGLKTVEVGRTVKDDLDTITAIRGVGGQNQYFRVKDTGRGRQVLVPVATPEALSELSNTREQIHTVSRVPGASECSINRSPEAAPVRPAAPVVPQTITLAADALFAFGRSDINAMSPMGRASLDALVQRLRSEYIKLDRLHIVGHADPIGNALSNERLSMDRAQTVRDYLMQSGVNTIQITSEGKGSREPVAGQCGLVATPDAIACHAPNRRVVIEIMGARR
jgi:OmpA-OmpF porin, OOP family